VFHAQWYRAVCPLGTKLLPDGTACTFAWGSACLTHRCIPARDVLPLLVQRELWRRSSGAFDRVLACSNAVRDRLVEAGIEPVHVLWNGIPERAPRPPLKAPPVIAFAGRLTREKGVDVLLEAFAAAQAREPDLSLEIYGDGPERPRLARRVIELRLSDRVELAGLVSHAELDARLDRAWIQVVPSLWQEPFGLVAAEAMMRGTAVVASRVGGLVEFVQDGRSGILVPPGDPSALENALRAVACDRELAERLGAEGRVFALRHLHQDVFVDGVLRLYRDMLAAC
jgi:glycosyltransferase involved in cell wall biosynthesis